jgi:cold shock protein
MNAKVGDNCLYLYPSIERLLSQSDCNSVYTPVNFNIFFIREPGRTVRTGNNQIINRPAKKGTKKQKNMNKGTVKFFNDTKGFGFIKGEDGQEIFVHVTGLNEDIRENDEVTYDTERGKKGLNAVNVSLAN